MVYIDYLKLIILENSIGLMHVGLFIFLYFSNFSYMSWGIFSLSKNINVSDECHQIWLYDCFGIIYAILYIIIGGYTFATTLKSAKNMGDMSSINNSSYLDYVFIPLLLCWGLIIISTISDECLNIYLSGHKDIWDLCQGTFYGVLSMVLILVILKVYVFVNMIYNYALWNTVDNKANKNIIENFNKIHYINNTNNNDYTDDDNYKLLQTSDED